MDSQLWLLIDFTIYIMLCWFPLSRMLQTDKSQDLARDQVWTDPGQQQLCKAPVIIPLLHIALLSYSWLVGNLVAVLWQRGWENVYWSFRYLLLTLHFTFVQIVHAKLVFWTHVCQLFCVCTTFNLMKLEKELKWQFMQLKDYKCLFVNWNVNLIWDVCTDIKRRNSEGIPRCSGAPCFHWSVFSNSVTLFNSVQFSFILISITAFIRCAKHPNEQLLASVLTKR